MAHALTKQYPVRPDVGTTGHKIRVFSNHFRLEHIPDTEIYQYAIEIVIDGFPGERKIPVKVAREIVDSTQIQNLLGAATDTFVYDGSTMAWSKDLISDFEVRVPRGRKEVTVTLKKTTSFTLGIIKDFLQKKPGSNTGVLEAINFLNHLFSASPRLSLIPVGRKFFSPQDHLNDIKKAEQIELRRGLFQSIHFGGQKSLTINVDVTTGVFWNSDCVTALDLAARILGKTNNHQLTPRSLTAVHFQQLSRALKGVKYRVKHRGPEFAKRQHSISRIVQQSSRDHRFILHNDEGDRSISVEEYMQSTYNIRLKYPDAVLLRKGDSTFMPMELCYIIPFQRYPQTLSQKHAREMIKYATKIPVERVKEISNKKKLLAHDKDPMLNAYKIRVAANMTEVEARKLPLPQLAFGHNSRPAITAGEWTLRTAVFKQGAAIRNWGILFFGDVGRALDAFIKTLVQTADDRGMQFVKRDPYRCAGNINWDAEEIARRLQKEVLPAMGQSLDLLMVIVPSKTSNIYVPVKRYCDCVAGIASQCLDLSKVQLKGTDRVFASNVLMKINSKLGGVNVSLREMPQILKTGTVFVGADVTHPAPGAPPTRASLATMTASLDPLACRYAAVAMNQTHRQEVIADAESMTKTLLTEFRRSTNTLPQRIIYLRDGVSEGQYAEIIRVELPAIRAAARSIVGTGPTIRISVIIVKKRHHTRLFPTHPREGDLKGNVLPGTVVDTGIVHPIEFDFFLVPHKAFQGTVRPAHYHVIHDENNFQANILQTLIYHQSYAFARSATAVSLHPAVYYAHLAGNRARVHDESIYLDDSATTISMGSGSGDHPVPSLKPLHAKLVGGRLAMWYL